MAYTIFIGGTEVRVAYLAIAGYITFCLSALLIVWIFFKEKTQIDKLAEAPDVDESNYDPTAILADVNINMKKHANKNKKQLQMEIDLAANMDRKRRQTEIQMAHLEPQKQNQPKIEHRDSQDTMTDFGSLNNINLSDNPLSHEQTNVNRILSMSGSTQIVLRPGSQRSTISKALPNLPDDEFPTLPNDEPSVELRVNSEANPIINTNYTEIQKQGGISRQSIQFRFIYSLFCNQLVCNCKTYTGAQFRCLQRKRMTLKTLIKISFFLAKVAHYSHFAINCQLQLQYYSIFGKCIHSVQFLYAISLSPI